MNFIKNISFILFAALLFSACESDLDTVTYDSSKNVSGTLSTIANNLTLTVADADDVAVAFEWTQSSFGFDAAIIYTVEADVKGKNFANPVTIGAVSLDKEQSKQKLEVKTLDLNTALNVAAKVYEMSVSDAIDFEFRVKSALSDNVEMYSNVITSAVKLFNPAIALPNAMHIIGSPFDWSWDKAVSLIPVNGFAGAQATPDADKSIYWMVRYFNAGDAIKFNFNKAWDGGEFGYSAASADAKAYADLSDDGGNIKIGKAGWYIVVVTTNRSADKASYAHSVDFFAPDIYALGSTVGTWDVPNTFKFTVPADGAGEFVSPAFTSADELRVSIKLKDIDWWRTEFIILDGKIAYRGNGGDQARVKVAVGQKAYLKFADGTGEIK